MGRFLESTREAAANIERISSGLRSMPDAGSFSGPGGASGGGSAVPPTVFNTTVVVPQANRTTNSPIGTRGDDIQSRAFAYYGLSSAGKSDAFIKQIVEAFKRLLASDPGMGLRMGASG